MPVLVGCLATYLFEIEGTICIVMYLPAGFILAGLGGLFARWNSGTHNRKMYSLLLLPFLVNWFEGQFQYPIEMQTVTNSIAIKATDAAVWSEIKSVRTISKSELGDSWVHKIGFPRPLSAEINREEVGGVRMARFERGLVFTETVDDWRPNQVLSFKIRINPKDIPPGALDEHVTIGGPFFDVLRGTYSIEKNSDGTLILNLKSQFRLSTHFNFYAGIWSHLVMDQIQSDILKVIKQRSEKT